MNTISLHTPWTLRTDLGVINTNGHHVAIVATQEAAQVVAAAPDLLAALQQSAEQMEVAAGVLWSRADGLDGLHKLAANALRNSAEKLRYQADQARAAIAKAVQS